jgi:hypothetical protein
MILSWQRTGADRHALDELGVGDFKSVDVEGNQIDRV